jgi:hypothetical protein
MKDAVAKPSTSNRQAIEEALRGETAETIAAVGSRKALTRKLCYNRQKSLQVPSNPKTVADTQIPSELTKTLAGKTFLLHDSLLHEDDDDDDMLDPASDDEEVGPENREERQRQKRRNQNRFFLFGTHAFLDLMLTYTFWLCDGT